MTSDVSHQIVRTKLAPPRLAGAIQRREELLASLDERRDKRLTVIIAPAGGGKSTLAALWRKQLVTAGRRVCWYNLGVEDSDDTQFVSYLVAALQAASPHLGDSAMALFNRAGGHSTAAFIGELVNDLLDIEEPVHLFLEDVHAVSGGAALALIQRLLDHAPPLLRVVMTSRTRPALDYLRLRVSDELNELTFSDLRFSLQESIGFLRGQGLNTLGASELHRLHSLADGWPAALQLLSFSLRKSRNPSLYLQRFSGPLTPDKEAALTDYLNSFVTPLLSARELDFLVRTSACRRFDVELCEVVTGDAEARRMLQRFVDDSLFVIPIDYEDDRQWYRFHMTFGKFLSDRLMRLPREELDRINRSASDWFAARGLHVEAIRHAFFAGDQEASILHIERVARQMVGSSQFLQLLKWFEQLPKEAVKDRTELLLCAAWASVACGRGESLDWCVSTVGQSSSAERPEVMFDLMLLKAVRLMRQDDTASAFELIQPYLEAPPRASRFLLYQLNAVASQVFIYADEFARVRVFARRSREVYGDRSIDTPMLDAWIGLSYLRQGDVRQAKTLLARSMMRAEQSHRVGAEARAHLAAYLAEVHYHLDELEDAAALLAQHEALIEAIGTQDTILSMHGTAALLHQLQGQEDAALEMVRRVEQKGMQGRLDRLIAWSLREQVRMLGQRGQVPAAQEALHRLEEVAQPYLEARRCAHADIPIYLGAARVDLLVARGNLGSSLDEARAVERVCQTRGIMIAAARLQVRQVAILLRMGEEAQAVLALRQALSTCATYGLLRVLMEGGKEIVPLLSGLVEDGALVHGERELATACIAQGEGSLTEVRAARPGPGRAPRSAKAAAEASGLSAKELEVVALLSKAFSNKSIARALNISPGTVKWHLKSIFSKLGAVSRENAVVKARNLDIVD